MVFWKETASDYDLENMFMHTRASLARYCNDLAEWEVLAKDIDKNGRG